MAQHWETQDGISPPTPLLIPLLYIHTPTVVLYTVQHSQTLTK